MIIIALCEIIYNLLVFLLPPLALVLPVGFQSVLVSLLSAIVQGFTFIAAFLDVGYVLGLLSALLVFDGIIKTWSIIMWILRKIPFLHIS